jgi:hypothetical protein
VDSEAVTISCTGFEEGTIRSGIPRTWKMVRSSELALTLDFRGGDSVTQGW